MGEPKLDESNMPKQDGICAHEGCDKELKLYSPRLTYQCICCSSKVCDDHSFDYKLVKHFGRWNPHQDNLAKVGSDYICKTCVTDGLKDVKNWEKNIEENLCTLKGCEKEYSKSNLCKVCGCYSCKNHFHTTEEIETTWLSKKYKKEFEHGAGVCDGCGPILREQTKSNIILRWQLKIAHFISETLLKKLLAVVAVCLTAAFLPKLGVVFDEDKSLFQRIFHFYIAGTASYWSYKLVIIPIFRKPEYWVKFLSLVALTGAAIFYELFFDK